MSMQKIWRFLLIAFFAALTLPLAAQDYDDEEPSAPSIDADWDDYSALYYTQGDNTFNVSVGVLLPTVFTGKGMNGPHNLIVGGTGSLSYNYFLDSNFFIGGEVSGMFAATIGGNMLYIIPFGIRGGFQFVVNRFEFPLSLMIGGAPQLYTEKTYFGLIFKYAASGYFRFNHDWSFGLNLQWWMLPQWPKDGRNVLGNFLEITLSARYHF